MSRQLPLEVRQLADEHRLGQLEAVYLQRGPRSLLLALASVLVLLAVLAELPEAMRQAGRPGPKPKWEQ